MISTLAALSNANSARQAYANGKQAQTTADRPEGQGQPTPGNAATVQISAAAQALLDAQAAVTANGMARYFPTRPGASATALAQAVTDPGATSSSTGKSFAQVTLDARASLDAKYADMKASGKPFDYNSFEGADWHTAFGDLDRRSLYAVASNSGGKFSAQEQDIAQSLMSHQQGLAMGLYAGPISQAGSFVDKYPDDTAGKMKAGMAFLDAVSPEEKSSAQWAVSRASAQWAYEAISASNGAPIEPDDSGSPLVRMLVKAFKALQHEKVPHAISNGGWIKNDDALQAMPLFDNGAFASELQTALAARRPAA